MVLLITAWYVNHHKPSVIYYANKSKSQHIKALRVQCLVFSYSTLISTAVGTFICAAVITKPQNQWHWFGDWPAEGENTREQLAIQRVLLILSECSVKLGWEDLQGAHMFTESVGLGEVVATVSAAVCWPPPQQERHTQISLGGFPSRHYRKFKDQGPLLVEKMIALGPE